MSDLLINTNPTFIEDVSKKNVKVAFDERVYLDTRLKEGEVSREVTIRILPLSLDNPNLWAEVKIHNLKVDKKINRSGFKSFTCLNTNKGGRNCPLCAKGSQLWQEAADAKAKGDIELSKSLEKSAKKYFSKDAYIVRCIERGKENEGVKFWRFNGSVKGDGIKDKIIALSQSMTNEMAKVGIVGYNMFDLMNGRDLKLMLTAGVANNGERITNITLTPSAFDTPLSQNIDLANQWLSDPKKWQDVYSVRSAEYLRIIADGKLPIKDKETGAYKGVDLNENNQYQQQYTPQAAPQMQPQGYNPQSQQQGYVQPQQTQYVQPQVAPQQPYAQPQQQGYAQPQYQQPMPNNGQMPVNPQKPF